jgi:hypothetical protein
MVGRKIAGIPIGLVERSPGHIRAALQFQDSDTAALQNNDIRSPGVPGKFVLEDGCVFLGRAIADFEFATLALQPRY